MILKEATISQISDEAKCILRKEMGICNTLRFLQQYSFGSGNYTKERRELFKDKGLPEIVEEIKNRRKM